MTSAAWTCSYLSQSDLEKGFSIRYTCQREEEMELKYCSFHTPYTTMNPKCMCNLDIKDQTIKQLENSEIRHLVQQWLEGEFFNHTTQKERWWWKIKSAILVYMKLKRFCIISAIRKRREAFDWEKNLSIIAMIKSDIQIKSSHNIKAIF